MFQDQKSKFLKALIIQHTEATPPGTTVEWLLQNNIPYNIHFFSSQIIPSNDYDLIFICGGGMNVDEEEKFPWLTLEKQFIKKMINEKKKIIGLCLGAQLLAESLGGKVFKAPHWEAGWQNVQLNHGKSIRAFEWHGYQFISPPESKITAFNEACAHQAFTYSDHIIAFQFHPESTVEWIIERANDPEKPGTEKFVQSKEEILTELERQNQLQAWYFEELNTFIL
jgi:GMP synthase (glutamine-hydrolysing)